MSDQFLGQIKLFGFGFAPRTYAQCSGQLLPVAQNQALFSLLATTYGGNGIQTFALPDLRSRTPLGVGTASSGETFPQGMAAGVENVSLLSTQIPQHTHTVNFSAQAAVARNPAGGLYADTGTAQLYAAGGPPVLLGMATVGATGGSQPHSNMQPYTVLNFCIALSGIFPSRG